MEREQLHREKQLREETQKEKEELQLRMQELQEQFHATQEAMVCWSFDWTVSQIIVLCIVDTARMFGMLRREIKSFNGGCIFHVAWWRSG